MKDKILNAIIIICLLLLFIIPFCGTDIKRAVTNLQEYQQNLKNKKNKKEIKVIKVKKLNNTNSYIKKASTIRQNIKVNAPTPLSYTTKDYVYQTRKKYVSESIFARANYEPSDIVFGSIIDNKPWKSINFCRTENDSHARIDGPSEETRFINNPTMLVAVEFPYTFSEDFIKYCVQPRYQMIPEDIEYSLNPLEIIVKYQSFPFHYSKDVQYMLNGINARDLGFNYAYVDKQRTAREIKFTEKNNITNQVIEFKNLIHLGYSCNVEGGCNNGSPLQPELLFIYEKNKDRKSKRLQIYIKLWKKRPMSPDDKPDAVEKIYFY